MLSIESKNTSASTIETAINKWVTLLSNLSKLIMNLSSLSSSLESQVIYPPLKEWLEEST